MPASTGSFSTTSSAARYQLAPPADRDWDDYEWHPVWSAEEIARWALEHDLPYFDDQAHFPDLRIEYELEGRSGHEDVEVLTITIRGAHGAAAARSGFTAYRGSARESPPTAAGVAAADARPGPSRGALPSTSTSASQPWRSSASPTARHVFS